MSENDPKSGWWLESILAVMPGLPWYICFHVWPIAILVHVALAIIYIAAVRWLFGRGAAVITMVSVCVLSILLLIGAIVLQKILTR